MRRLVLGEPWTEKRLKAIRFGLIHLPCRMVRHARRLVIRLSAGHSCLPLLLDARATIRALAQAPPAPPDPARKGQTAFLPAPRQGNRPNPSFDRLFPPR